MLSWHLARIDFYYMFCDRFSLDNPSDLWFDDSENLGRFVEFCDLQRDCHLLGTIPNTRVFRKLGCYWVYTGNSIVTRMAKDMAHLWFVTVNIVVLSSFNLGRLNKKKSLEGYRKVLIIKICKPLEFLILWQGLTETISSKHACIWNLSDGTDDYCNCLYLHQIEEFTAPSLAENQISGCMFWPSTGNLIP